MYASESHRGWAIVAIINGCPSPRRTTTTTDSLPFSDVEHNIHIWCRFMHVCVFAIVSLHNYMISQVCMYVFSLFGFGNTIPFGTPDSISDFWNSDYSSHISFPSFSRILLFLSQIPQRLKQKQKKTKNRYLIWSTFVTNRSLYLPADRWKKKWTKETRELANTKNRFL